MVTGESAPDSGMGLGRCFEDFQAGDVYHHALGRTITDADNYWFTNLTMNQNPIHFDANYAKNTAYRRPLVNSCLTLALVTGLSVADLSINAVANLGWDAVRLPVPVFAGDTLYAASKVLSVRPSRSQPNAGIVRVQTVGMNQDGTVVIEFERAIMVHRRSHAPGRPPLPDPFAD